MLVRLQVVKFSYGDVSNVILFILTPRPNVLFCNVIMKDKLVKYNVANGFPRFYFY